MDNERINDGSTVDPSTKKRELESGTEPSKGQKRQKPDTHSFADGWESSDPESELEDYLIPNRLVMTNLHADTVKRDIERFFGGKATSVSIADVNSQNEPIRTAYIWFNSLQDTKDGFKKQGQPLRGLPVRMKRVPNNWIVLSVSGFEPGLAEDLIKGQLRAFFKSCGTIRKIFVPKDKKTGQCLSFGYVYMKQTDTKAEEKDLDEMEGRKINVINCTWEVRFRVIKAAMKAEGGWDTEECEDDSSDCDGGVCGNFFDDDDDDDDDDDVDVDVDVDVDDAHEHEDDDDVDG